MEETVVSRDAESGLQKLLCGDGMKRILAVKWMCLT